jgi:hypothetical protein
MTDTAIELATTTRTCPPSAVVDMIVRWQDVQAGDLVVLDDCLIVAERVEVYQSPWGDGTTFPQVNIYQRLDNGHLVSSERHGDRYTAVRRYTEGTDDDALILAALDEAAEDRTERAGAYCDDCVQATLAAEERGDLDVFRAGDRDKYAGLCDSHREDLDRASQYRELRDRLEAGRG